jgi:integrase
MLSSILLMNALQKHAGPSKNTRQELVDLLLLASLINQGTGDRGRGTRNPERLRLRGMRLREFVAQCYLPERNHALTGPTAELAKWMLDRLRDAMGREILVKEMGIGELKRFRAWLAMKVARGLSPATANIHLRQLRAIWNHAARWQWADNGKKWRAIKPPPPIEFFPEPEPDFDAWTPQQNVMIEDQARKLDGFLPPIFPSPVSPSPSPVPLSIFWTAWTLVLQALGCRITAMMLAMRTDYDPEAKALLLRRENQKQKKDQRIALPPRAAAAVERLLAAHDHDRIFGCWPFDPPEKSTGRRHWRVLTKHFERLLVIPAGLILPKGVKTRQFRRTAATILEENGGNAQELLGHSDRKTTERYKDRKRRPICRQSLLMPDGRLPQKMLF